MIINPERLRGIYGDPPQRLAATEGHPWFHPYWSPRCRVIVNGIERAAVTLADGPGRWAEALVLPLTPGTDGKPVTMRFEGDVVIVEKEMPG